MRKPSLPPLAQLVKAYRDDPHAMADQLYRLYQGNPSWGYNFCAKILEKVYSGKIKRKQIKAACYSQKMEVSRHMNWEVLTTLFDDQNIGKVSSAPYPAVYYPIRHDLKIRVKPACYFIKDGQVYIVWLQPWKNFGLSHEQKALLATIIRKVAIEEADDFMSLEPPAELYMIDASAPEQGELRQLKVFNFADFELLSDDGLKDVLSTIAKAYDLFVEKALESPKKVRRKRDKPSDDSQLDLGL